ncbi:glycosyltransferase [Abditibacterium utsteinense]|nr:glycosyltransferase [Abditibacterium utsteinense]
MITYNHEKFIEQAVASVIAQETSFDYEIVIGEDCSKDRTREILLDLQKTYPDKIRLLLPPQNIGMHENFAQTLSACTGQYVAILEGDDYWTSTQKLQKQVDDLDNHPNCVICFHAVRIFHEDRGHPDQIHPHTANRISTIEDLIVNNFIPTLSVMFRNGFIDNLPQWLNTLPMADWPFNILNAQHGDILFINEVMADYRSHEGGVWSSISTAKKLQGIVKMHEVVNNHFKNKYSGILNPAISNLYFMTAIEHENSGNIKDACLCSLRSLTISPFKKSMSRKDIIKLFFRLHLKLLAAKLPFIKSDKLS